MKCDLVPNYWPIQWMNEVKNKNKNKKYCFYLQTLTDWLVYISTFKAPKPTKQTERLMTTIINWTEISYRLQIFSQQRSQNSRTEEVKIQWEFPTYRGKFNKKSWSIRTHQSVTTNHKAFGCTYPWAIWSSFWRSPSSSLPQSTSCSWRPSSSSETRGLRTAMIWKKKKKI